MFGIGSTELIIIIVVALIVIGPQKLPQMMRSLGKGMAEFKRMSTDVTETLDREVKEAEKSIREQELKDKLAAEEAARKKAEQVLSERENTEQAAAGAEAPQAPDQASDQTTDEASGQLAQADDADKPAKAEG